MDAGILLGGPAVPGATSLVSGFGELWRSWGRGQVLATAIYDLGQKYFNILITGMIVSVSTS